MTITFMRGKQRFEIKRAKRGCAGYVDGVLSVTGPNAHTVARVLIKKHINGMPKAQVVSFIAKLRERGVERLTGSEPDLAG